ncbi:zinc finger CCCH domain-containing protein 67-like isoform X2 [Cornus florida]|uniref:zinc finger CCCH domain-containing protein 67-like isoform X2 n=1 Tax=Cornus florida TaxID=4283 RepID=UPI0028A162CA|nr:zinc finger CCCH domain-containing protein 67-like isoform X2 [Cornus florida]
MGSCEDNDALKLQPEEPELGFASPASNSHSTHSALNSNEEEALVQEFENVGLELEENKVNDDDDYQEGNTSLDDSRLYPLRPYAEDCTFYLKTGACKFGSNCKFNHPARRTTTNQDKDTEGLSENEGQTECKYYLTAGGCKYGKSCRYIHKDESEFAPPELNFLGLPIRLGEKECPFYMRKGICGYGARCRFHHPDPTTVGGVDNYNSSPNDESVRRFNLSSQDHNGEPIPLHLSGSSQSAQASWTLHGVPNNIVPYQANHSSYVPATHLLPQGAHQNLNWNGYQVPNYPEDGTTHDLSAPAAKNLMGKAKMSTQAEEFPERPGQPECEFFMKTGNCKFKSACRYHHPRSPAPKLDFYGPSDKSLPLRPVEEFPERPGQAECEYFMKTGDCKFKSACRYHHPKSQAPNSEVYVLSDKGLPVRYAPNYLEDTARRNLSAPAAKSYTETANMETQVEEFPERLGQPECEYFMKTGDCKYKSACRYHHPKSQPPKLDACVLSDKGLPLRPGTKICRHYERYGICKYGRACLFDHPVNYRSSASPVGSILGTPSSSNSATPGGTRTGSRMAGHKDGNEATIKQLV